MVRKPPSEWAHLFAESDRGREPPPPPPAPVRSPPPPPPRLAAPHCCLCTTPSAATPCHALPTANSSPCSDARHAYPRTGHSPSPGLAFYPSRRRRGSQEDRKQRILCRLRCPSRCHPASPLCLAGWPPRSRCICCRAMVASLLSKKS